MLSSDALWSVDDPNLAILPRWTGSGKGNLTAPFVDTHVAVRFLGGVSNYSQATAAGCVDRIQGCQSPGGCHGVDVDGIWCDLVVRQPDGSLKTRLDLIHSRLDRYFDSGIDLMIVMGDVPWAFVDVKSEVCDESCEGFVPPSAAPGRVRCVDGLARSGVCRGLWARLRVADPVAVGDGDQRPALGDGGWGAHGKVFDQVLDSYKRTMRSIVSAISGAQVGASNWVEVVGSSGNLSLGGSDDFQYRFYKAMAADSSIPLDWIAVSHYGGGGGGGGGGKGKGKGSNFPSPDYVQRTPFGDAGEVELQAMRELAARPNASLEVMGGSNLCQLRVPARLNALQRV